MPISAIQALEQAAAAAARGDCWGAATRLRQAFATTDVLGRRWQDAIAIATRIADDHGRVLAARRLREECGCGTAETLALAEALTEAGQAPEAIGLLQPLADAGALDPDQLFRLTRMLMFAGRTDDALARARGLLASHGDSATLWERIAQLKRFEPGDPDIDAMRAVFDRTPATRPVARAAIATALASACVDAGDDRGAHLYLEARAGANRIRFPFDARPLELGLRDTLAWCRSGEDDAPAAPGDSHRAIFIIGPLRSGTSLLDQVFSRHPAIGGGGELKHLWLATRELGDSSSAGIGGYLRSQAGLQPPESTWTEFGRRYLALASERFGTACRFTDKLLSNVYRIRAIRAALPDAAILSIRRDPVDVAWSCWRAQFDAESAWANSPESIALYLACHRRMMEAWKSRYPDAIIEIGYEDLVRHPEREIPRILGSCGLNDDPATREPHRSPRPVITLSFAQVRSPIHTQSIGQAAAFPIATRKLREALADAGEIP